VRRFLYDTAVFVYALGSEHRYREPCRSILREAQRGALDGEASLELVHEFAYVRLRQSGDRGDAVHWARTVARICRLHAVERADIERALTLWCEHERLAVRNAIFAATALNRGIEAILSPDRDFDDIPGVQRIDPMDSTALAMLTA
jgi:predicted nucleic acid-binding protein